MHKSERNILGVIPARGGSVGIPGKNLRELRGKPLMAYTIEAALGARRLGRVVVSTDDPRIAKVAREHGAEAPFLRPPGLAADDTPMIPVLAHALGAIDEAGTLFDAVACLQPTSPFRGARHIDEAIELFEERAGGALASVCPVRESPLWMLRVEDGVGTPFMDGGLESHSRQLLPELFRLNGAIFIYSREIVLTRLTVPPELQVYEMDEADSVDIDTEADWLLAESLINGAG